MAVPGTVLIERMVAADKEQSQAILNELPCLNHRRSNKSRRSVGLRTRTASHDSIPPPTCLTSVLHNPTIKAIADRVGAFTPLKRS